MSNQVLETIQKRSSARAYTKEMPTKEQIDTIIEAGLQAPTATNRREIRFSIVPGDADILKELDAEKKKLRGQKENAPQFCYDAPLLILLSAEDGFNWSKVDAGIAVQNMALAAESLGLGNLIVGCIYDAMHGEKKEYFDKALQIPEGYSFEIALAVGQKTDAKKPHTYEKESQVFVVQ